MTEADPSEDGDVFLDMPENPKSLNRITSSHRRKSSYVVEQVINYCPSLMKVEFVGQSSDKAHPDENDECTVLNIGLYISILDKVIRKYKKPTSFTVDDEEFRLTLKLVATKRRLNGESTEECYERLLRHSKIFERVYHERGVISERLKTTEYWGTWQQLLCGKVIADWLDPDHVSLDPIFGVLLNPTGGRVGPGDTGWMHNLLYDDRGFMAYHSGVHDAFGYLLNFHNTGPGYDYLKESMLSKSHPFSGQIDGIYFWRKLLKHKKIPESFSESPFEAMAGNRNDDGVLIC